MKHIHVIFMFAFFFARAQEDCVLRGTIVDQKGEPLPFAGVVLDGVSAQSDAAGNFTVNGSAGKRQLLVSAVGYRKFVGEVQLPMEHRYKVTLIPTGRDVEEVVVTGTMREVAKDDSPINIDLISPKLMQKTATPNLFEATSLVNGVKPQINCNVCNTGDIHINGMEGPYTLILIDGMPIVSGLSSVYGLMGIPASIIERLEIAKGPASSLYGSEAMGGTINVVTKNAFLAPRFSADVYSTSYLENNADLGGRIRFRKADWLVGSNVYFFNNKVDFNADNFTDVTLQKRASLFSKVSLRRSEGREFTVAGRLVYEDRWGGEMNWNKNFRGGDSVYGESIYTSRAEVISKYQWPLREKVFTQLSYNFHDQNSAYGRSIFLARQSTGFFQTYWTKQAGRHDLLAGVSLKTLWYDDNTAVTKDSAGNRPDLNNNIGAFVQHEMSLDSVSKHRVLFGLRVDRYRVYGFVPSPRIAYKWTPRYNWIFRLNAGTGFRIVNVFTEDHMALTGARDVVFVEKIRPEQSYNASVNAIYKMRLTASSMLLCDGSAFYYHFTNKIYANYDIDPQKVIYGNLDGHAFSRGVSLNLTLATPGNFKFISGVTYADVQNVRRDSAGVLRRSLQLQSPVWSGNMILSYHFGVTGIRLDLTGNWYGPQRLPVFPNDFRPSMSPWYCLLNVQGAKALKNNFEIYAGAKNLLNFIPENPIMRPHDPFDKKVAEPIDNPNGYTFDPSYNYAPIQGIRFYLGVRVNVN